MESLHPMHDSCGFIVPHPKKINIKNQVLNRKKSEGCVAPKGNRVPNVTFEGGIGVFKPLIKIP